MKKLLVIFFCFLMILTLCNCKNDSTQNENNQTLITGEGFSLFLYPPSSNPEGSKSMYLHKNLKEKMTEYSGKDVWFRVVAGYSVSEEDKNSYIQKINEKLLRAEELGAKNILEVENPSDFYEEFNSYYMELTADMINTLYSDGDTSFYLAPPKRIEGFNNKISDTLTNHLSSMSDEDEKAIIAVLIYDFHNRYAGQQGVGNCAYNNILSMGLDFEGGFKDLDLKMEQKILNILERNTIEKKRIIDDTLPKIGGKDDWELVAGFNAILTKVEILKLAEDDDIKVIYSANS